MPGTTQAKPHLFICLDVQIRGGWASGVSVRVFLLESRLVNMLMRMFSPALVGVRVLVLDVFVLVFGVRVGMRLSTVAVLVHVDVIMVVLFGHGDPFLGELGAALLHDM